MKREGLWVGFASVLVVSLIAIGLLSVTIGYRIMIGPILIFLALLSLIPLKLAGRTIKSCSADIVFGSVDTFLLGIAAIIGASFAGIVGAIVGAGAGDAITDGFAGLWEGRMAQYLRKHGIEEGRTPLSASLGKMSGCFLGIGILLTLVWTIMGVKL